MIQTPVIVTFANQKGGVGKTTLCVTFANYLVTNGVRVVVIDCDFQHSIMKCRKADIRKYGEQEMPYEVWAYEANDKAMMTSLMEKLHNDPEIDVVLMDSPGSLKAEGLIPIFVNSDIIIVPFHYDLITVPLKVINSFFILQFNLHSYSPVFFRYRYYRCCRLFCRRVSVFCGRNCLLVPVPGCRTALHPEHRCSLLPAPDGSADDSSLSTFMRKTLTDSNLSEKRWKLKVCHTHK